MNQEQAAYVASGEFWLDQAEEATKPHLEPRYARNSAITWQVEVPPSWVEVQAKAALAQACFSAARAVADEQDV